MLLSGDFVFSPDVNNSKRHSVNEYNEDTMLYPYYGFCVFM
jgi:hypothetical protein